jgi:ankyrin repeat protein
VVKALASLGADVTTPNDSGWTPLFIAVCPGRLEEVEARASLGVDVNVPVKNGTTLDCMAAWNGRLEVVKALASLGADVTIPRHDGRAPIFAAARLGYLEMVKALISLGASVSSSNKDGWTPLHAAAGCPNAAVWAFLLANAGRFCFRRAQSGGFGLVRSDRDRRRGHWTFLSQVRVPTHLCLMSSCGCDSCAAADISELHFACRPCDIDFCTSCAPPPS